MRKCYAEAAWLGRHCFCADIDMNSINKQQPEDNYEDLFGESAQKKIKEMVDKAGTCFFCTAVSSGWPFATRPMAIQKVDAEGALWFLSANDSHHDKEIAEDNSVQLLFQGSSYSDFLNLYGKATISQDKKKIKELWNPMLKTWFTGGVDDPRISVIKVEPEGGYYWDTKNNMAIGMIKRVAGAIMGKTLDDSIEGQIKV
ncbi:MAG TPA: pyridoxamine 5'-phosphate oxidase family protein [Chitinophagaceae bacterium]